MTSKPLILKKYTNDEQQCSIKVDGRYVQLLKPFQIQGIRFLFSNYINGRGAILNDDEGLGKTVQTVLFLSAIHFASKPLFGALILCTLENINHWMFHFHKWSDVQFNIHHEGHYQSTTKYAITTLDSCAEYLLHEWDIVVVDDLEIKSVIKHLQTVKCRHKLWLAKSSLYFDFRLTYNLLDWISDGTIGNRNKFFGSFGSHIDDDIVTQWKKRKLLNVFTNRWMLRRISDSVKSDLPLTDEKAYLQEFNEWLHRSTDPNKLPDSISIDSQDNCSPLNDAVSQNSVEIIGVCTVDTEDLSPSMLDCSVYFDKSSTNADDFMKRKGTKDTTGLKIKRTRPEHNVTNQYVDLSNEEANVSDAILDNQKNGNAVCIIEDKSSKDVLDQTDAVKMHSKSHFLDSILNSNKLYNIKQTKNKRITIAKDTSHLSKHCESNVAKNAEDFHSGSLKDTIIEKEDKYMITETIDADVIDRPPHFLDVLFHGPKTRTRDARVSFKKASEGNVAKQITVNNSLSDCRTQTGNIQIKTHFNMLDAILFSSRR